MTWNRLQKIALIVLTGGMVLQTLGCDAVITQGIDTYFYSFTNQAASTLAMNTWYLLLSHGF